VTAERSRRIGAVLAVALVVEIISAPAARAQGMPDAARDAFDRGVAAAQQGAWDIAIRQFIEALKVAPSSPQILFALGLAHQSAGQAVPAAVFLRAYLESSPKAANAAQVRQEALRLEVAIDQSARALVEDAVAATRQLPADARADAYRAIARALIDAGERERAQAIARESPLEMTRIMAEAALDARSAGLGGTAWRRFDLAEAQASAEADAIATRVGGPNYGGCQGRLVGDPEFWRVNPDGKWELDPEKAQACREKREKEWKAEAPRRAVFAHGGLLTALAWHLKEAGFHARAYRTLMRGQDLFKQAAYPSGATAGNDRFLFNILFGPAKYRTGPAGSPGSAGFVALLEGGAVIRGVSFHTGTGAIVFDPNRRDEAATDPPRRPVSWSTIARAYGIELGPRTLVDLDDPLFVDLPGALRPLKERPAQEIPARLAEMAGTLLKVRNLLQRGDVR
jgi:tetratricopeptide (TPR) repeat protein